MNPDQNCNFDCVYCDVDCSVPKECTKLNVKTMSQELQDILLRIRKGEINRLSFFQDAPQSLLKLRDVALSGEGEPTLCKDFYEIVREVLHIRKMNPLSYFKLILITNATGLHFPKVVAGLQLFSEHDEVWVKLDAGTQAYMERVNRSRVLLDKVLINILNLSRRRPVIIQSSFCKIKGEEPSDTEIKAYIQRLLDLKEEGAKISLVQIYSASRKPVWKECSSLSLSRLSSIARQIHRATKLKVEVF